MWLIPREGAAVTREIAEVALRLRTWKRYTYAVPPPLDAIVAPGAAVRVPYGRRDRLVEGWCIRRTQAEWESTLKPIESAESAAVPLPAPLVDLALWVSEYYACPPGFTLEAFIPAPLRAQPRRKVRYCRRIDAAPEPDSLTAPRAAVLERLAAGPCAVSVLRSETGAKAADFRWLRAKGLIESFVQLDAAPPRARPGETVHRAGVESPEDAYALTPEQTAAIAAISAAAPSDAPSAFRVFLLFGVPGSGKTEVYVRAIRAQIAMGRQAIVLVPEIALATQVVDRLARRFGRVAVLHSRLRPRVRAATLRAVAEGAVDVVIGTRTAVFAPCPRLGLIVVDEEQESSFKSLAAPFYHARDVAIKRGQIETIPVVLGSATPALETWHNATALRRFTLLELPSRVPGAVLPRVQAVDMRREALAAGKSILAPTLRKHLGAVLAAGEQAIILHNRRGYAIQLRCDACGLGVNCPRCGLPMIQHLVRDRMLCHHCGSHMPTPAKCLDDSCGGRLVQAGRAIQRLEEEIAAAFPAARLLRLDRDTMRRREDYAAALGRFERRDADVLIGTQMVAKGLDFPAVRLVGVLEADAMLALPDFRAAERAFQLIVQVVGRAGRKEADSLALIHTHDPANNVLKRAMALDYAGFAAEELAVRRELGYPPLGRLIRIVVADARADTAREGAETIAAALRRVAGRVSAKIQVHDPQPCAIPRLRDRFRFEILVVTPRELGGPKLLAECLAEKAFSTSAKRMTIDVDPLEMS